MKKLLPIAASLFFGAGIAQTSQDFENWSGSPMQPQGWASTNVIVLPPFLPNDTVCHRSTDKFTGTYAMKLETIKLANNAGTGLDTVSFAITGTIGFSGTTPTIATGYPFINRPTELDFYYKYAPQMGDSATAGIILTKWNTGTNSRDTVAKGLKHFSAQSVYTLGTVNLTYSPAYATSGSPDSAFVYFASSCIRNFAVVNNTIFLDQTARIGSLLWVDDWYTTAVGINELVKGVDYNAYPVPANDQYTVSFKKAEKRTVTVFDVNGKLIESLSFSDKTFSIKTSSYKNGVYLMRVTDEAGSSAASDRFIVAH